MILIADRFNIVKAWKASELDRAHQTQLQAEAEHHRQEIIRLQEEAKRRQE
jgi:hypothetical protein